MHRYDEGFQGLLRRARDFANDGEFDARCVSNTSHAIAKLHEERWLDVTDAAVAETLAALERAAVQTAPDMTLLGVQLTTWAFLSTGRELAPETRSALETAAARLAEDTSLEDIVSSMWAYNQLGGSAWAALDDAVRRAAPEMHTQTLLEIIESYARGRDPSDETWAALEAAVRRFGLSYKGPHATLCIVNALAYLGSVNGRQPDRATWYSLFRAVRHMLTDTLHRSTVENATHVDRVGNIVSLLRAIAILEGQPSVGRRTLTPPGP